MTEACCITREWERESERCEEGEENDFGVHDDCEYAR